MDIEENNRRYYAAQAQRFKMGHAMNEYARVSSILREKHELLSDLLLKHPDTLTDEEREALKRYQELKEEADALYCMGTTGSYPPGYVPRPRKESKEFKGWES